MVLHVSGRQAGASQQCRITRQQYGSKLEAAGIQATLYVMMCTVKTHHLFLVLHLLLLHRLRTFVWNIYFFLLGCRTNLLASVSVHVTGCLPPILPLCESQRAPVLFLVMLCDHYAHYLQTSMTLLIPPLIPAPGACLCLSFNHIPVVFFSFFV